MVACDTFTQKYNLVRSRRLYFGEQKCGYKIELLWTSVHHAPESP